MFLQYQVLLPSLIPVFCSLIPPHSMRKKKKNIKCELCKRHKAIAIIKTLGDKKLKVCRYCFHDLMPYIKSYRELSHRKKYVFHHDIISGKLVPCKI